MSVTVIIEGGSQGSESVDKKGFVQLFGKVCPGRQPKVRMAQGRSKAMKAFLDELKTGNDAVLLVDSEGPCDHPTGHALLVATTSKHGVAGIVDARIDDVHLMVQVMESWFFADPEGLKSRVRDLDSERLSYELQRHNGNVELIPKEEALRVFREACGSKYKKVGHLEFIGRIDPTKLAAASERAASLFRRLQGPSPV